MREIKTVTEKETLRDGQRERGRERDSVRVGMCERERKCLKESDRTNI